jgi:hypothetical protein
VTYEERCCERLLRKVVVEDRGHDTPCWVYTGAKTYGYGAFGMHSRTVKAHRASYEFLVGPIPEGLHIDHLCRVRACVNPSHLEPVTPGENVMRGIGFAPVNAAKTHCKRGHEFTPENTYITSQGWRTCRQCQREWKWSKTDERRAARGLDSFREIAKRKPRAPRGTHCKHGHAYDEANTYVDPRGKRQCRTCIRERYEARNTRIQEAA